jgi:Family of unknown function (DUF6173)
MNDRNSPFRNEYSSQFLAHKDLSQHITTISNDPYRRNNPVLDVFSSIKNYIAEFEASLEVDQEVAARLASFGGVLLFHVTQIGFSKPNLVTFYGVTSEGEKVQLIQHVSQLNFLLKAVPKHESKAKRIGFIWQDDNDAL